MSDIESRYKKAKSENARKNRIKEVLRTTNIRWGLLGGGFDNITPGEKFFARNDVKRQFKAASMVMGVSK